MDPGFFSFLTDTRVDDTRKLCTKRAATCPQCAAPWIRASHQVSIIDTPRLFTSSSSSQNNTVVNRQRKLIPLVTTTGRQPPPLYSVLYEIISKRHCVLTAAQLLLREKSGAQRVGIDSNIPRLPGGPMKFIWWKLKMSYHTAYPSWDRPVVVCVCHLFLFSFCTNNCIHFIVKILYMTALQCFLPILGPFLMQGFIFEKGPTIYKIV